jgi:transcriptional regulator with XRE-family HTH domain
MNIGKAIKQLRQKYSPELNQREFAKAIGLSQTYLSQIESDQKNPSTDILKRISEYLKIPLPVMLWFSLSIDDVEESRKEAYRTLKPSVDALLNGMFAIKLIE